MGIASAVGMLWMRRSSFRLQQSISFPFGPFLYRHICFFLVSYGGGEGMMSLVRGIVGTVTMPSSQSSASEFGALSIFAMHKSYKTVLITAGEYNCGGGRLMAWRNCSGD